MCSKVKIVFKNGECYALFNGFSYQLDCKEIPSIISEIKNYSERYKRYNEKIIEEAASLGTIVIPTTLYGRNLFQVSLEKKIERILTQRAIKKYRNLLSYK